ncbi:MAG: redox-regulated ATPase YchF [Anaerolineales bacterium]|nr:redox-regulated ATPase YchF [Anaerolineales bacterium]
MRLGIIGLPQSGKTTVFNALTRGDQPTRMSGGRFEVHTAVVDVPDRRVDQLAEIFRPHKTTYAKVTYADIAGLEGGARDHGGHGLSGPLLNQLSQMDGFVHVARCFENVSVPHLVGSVDARRDIEMLDDELLLNDLISVERKLERLVDERRRGAGRDKAQIEWEWALFEKLRALLASGKPLRDLALSRDEDKALAGYALLTRKPVLLLLNISDGQAAPAIDYLHAHSALAALQGKLEMELAQLDEEEAQLFMAEFDIQELGLQRVIRLSYDLLDLQSFFTVGEDEVRAWTVRRGSTAIEAAGAIHTDLQKGFIRAEVMDYADLISLGGITEARARGRLRLEGKEYAVHDGEIMHVRFNV